MTTQATETKNMRLISHVDRRQQHRRGCGSAPDGQRPAHPLHGPRERSQGLHQRRRHRPGQPQSGNPDRSGLPPPAFQLPVRVGTRCWWLTNRKRTTNRAPAWVCTTSAIRKPPNASPSMTPRGQGHAAATVCGGLTATMHTWPRDARLTRRTTSSRDHGRTPQICGKPGWWLPAPRKGTTHRRPTSSTWGTASITPTLPQSTRPSPLRLEGPA